MSGPIRLDYGNMRAHRLGGRGVSDEALTRLAARFRTLHADVAARREAGELGFFSLPYERDVVGQIRAFGSGPGQAFDTVVVLGIGGSALGTIALSSALLPPRWNELDDEARDYFPRLYVLDNVDPDTVAPLLDRLDPARTLFNVVSKSGSTAETMAQYLIVRDRLQASLGADAANRHLLFTTDREHGELRRIASDDGVPALPIPADVGGRFSVLSAVSLLPAALVGIDIDELLAGAAAMDERCASADLEQNPAGLFALLQHHAHEDHGAGIHVMMPYADRLVDVADWFRQLWAESLGKRLDRQGREVFRGPTPIKARGVTDQHSQTQLYMEGPFDKTVTFLSARAMATDIPIPRADSEALAYLGGHTLAALLAAEQRATAHALAAAGRMNMTIELARIDAHTIGQLLMMLQIATVYAGVAYDVNPLDQPGVELGKRLAYGLLGRPGYETPADDPQAESR